MPFFTSWRSFLRTDWSAAGCKGTGAIADPSVNYIVTVPGSSGVGVAFAEVIISFGLMTTVPQPETSSVDRRVFAGILVATYITLEVCFQA